MNACRVCAGTGIEPLLELGPQPICNRYLGPGSGPEYLHPMTLVRCEACGVVQVADAVPWSELQPKLDWITYKEPEAHLDAVADLLAASVGPGEPRSACGISFKDDPLLDRLKARGFEPIWRIDPARDLGRPVVESGVESLQATVDVAAARRLARDRGRVGLVIARHIFEHCHSIPGFLAALQELRDPRGAIVLELPDSQRAFESLDYSALWEEHVVYFTEQTLRKTLEGQGLQIERLVRYPYPMEDVFATVLRPGKQGPAATSASAEERATVRRFSGALAAVRSGLHRAVDAAGGKVALFGAGHRACLWINVMDLKDRLAFVVDDDPHKVGLRMPGSGLPIVPSSSLVKEGVRLCLLTVSSESEERVLQRNRAFLDAGGRFASIYPFSRLGLPIAQMAGEKV